MNSKFHNILLALLLICSSCVKNSSEEFKDNYEKKVLYIPIKPKLTDFDPVIQRLVRLETKKESLIAIINQLKVYDNKIFLLDAFQTKGVFVFTMQGDFKYKIAEHGKGPGELISPSSLLVDNETEKLEIYDNAIKGINRYELNGKFVDFLPVGLAIDAFDKTKMGVYIFSLNNKPNYLFDETIRNNLIYYDKDRGVVMEFYPYSGSGLFYELTTFRSLTRNDKNEILYLPNTDPTVYLAGNSSLNKHWSIKFDKEFIDKKSIDKHQASIKFYNEIAPISGKVFRITNFIESNEYIFFSFCYKTDLYDCIIDKELCIIKYLNTRSQLSRDLFGVSNCRYIGYYNNTVIFSITSEDWLKSYKPETLINQNNCSVLDELNDVSNGDNCILLFVNFN